MLFQKCLSISRISLKRNMTTLLHNGNIKENLLKNDHLELTLAIIKPHICKDPFSLEEIHQMMLENDFLFIQTKRMQMNKQQAETFYKEHQDKFFYNRLITLMTSGESLIHILAGENAIIRWRKLMGTTKVYKTRLDQPETIRGKFGCTDTRNATHGSDSPITARKEIEFFFPNFSFDLWFQQEENRWRECLKEKSQIIIDKNEWIHKFKK